MLSNNKETSALKSSARLKIFTSKSNFHVKNTENPANPYEKYVYIKQTKRKISRVYIKSRPL